jgi:hypothetical protein
VNPGENCDPVLEMAMLLEPVIGGVPLEGEHVPDTKL